jgi:phosphodiesterase/alkaline phosphatase D-like protein
MQKIQGLISYSRAKVLLGLVAALSFVFLTGSVLAAAPQVTTLPATATETTLTLNAMYSGNSGTIQVRFEWGTTPNLGTFTQYQTSTTSSGTYYETLTGLTAGTTYYFRAEGINADGPAWGSTLNKPTVAYTLPQIQTMSYSGLSSTTVDAGYWYQSGSAATVTIEYANNSQLIGAYTQSESKAAGSGGDSITLTGLTPNTTYWYRAKITNSGGTRTATTAIQFTTTAAGGTGTSGTGGTTGYNRNYFWNWWNYRYNRRKLLEEQPEAWFVASAHSSLPLHR